MRDRIRECYSFIRHRGSAGSEFSSALNEVSEKVRFPVVHGSEQNDIATLCNCFYLHPPRADAFAGQHFAMRQVENRCFTPAHRRVIEGRDIIFFAPRESPYAWKRRGVSRIEHWSVCDQPQLEAPCKDPRVRIRRAIAGECNRVFAVTSVQTFSATRLGHARHHALRLRQAVAISTASGRGRVCTAIYFRRFATECVFTSWKRSRYALNMANRANQPLVAVSGKAFAACPNRNLSCKHALCLPNCSAPTNGSKS